MSNLVGRAKQDGSRRNVMITGCAGFIGRALSRYLITNGLSVVGLYREKLPEALERMIPLCSDMRSSEALFSPLRNVDTVVHLAWEGGILGSSRLRAGNAGQERILLGANLTMTRNLVRAMERQGVKKIIFIGWLGSTPSADMLIQREKYWAENIILNSAIKSKIIVRSGVVVDPKDKSSPFGVATQRMTKLPLIMPLPCLTDNILLTSMSGLLEKIVSLLQPDHEPGAEVLELSSMDPQASSRIVSTVMSSWWGQRKMAIGGPVGSKLFSIIDSDFGRLPKDSPRIRDFLTLSSSAGCMLARQPQNKAPALDAGRGSSVEPSLFS